MTMPKQSAGILMYRRRGSAVEVLLVHPGGPFWRKKDMGAWSIPKGEHDTEENALEAARREFKEETGSEPEGDLVPLGAVKQSGGKTVHAWAIEGDCDPSKIRSNAFSMEWPPKSGKTQSFPEIDRAAWFSVEDARGKLHKGQVPFLDRLLDLLERS